MRLPMKIETHHAWVLSLYRIARSWPILWVFLREFPLVYRLPFDHSFSCMPASHAYLMWAAGLYGTGDQCLGESSEVRLLEWLCGRNPDVPWVFTCWILTFHLGRIGKLVLLPLNVGIVCLGNPILTALIKSLSQNTRWTPILQVCLRIWVSYRIIPAPTTLEAFS